MRVNTPIVLMLCLGMPFWTLCVCAEHPVTIRNIL